MRKNKRYLLFLIIFLSFSLLFAVNFRKKAEKILKTAIIIDAHEDTPATIHRGIDITKPRKKGQIDLPAMFKGHLNAPVFAVWTPNRLDNVNPEFYTFNVISDVYRFVNRNRKYVEIVKKGKDIERIIRSGKIAIILSLENSSAMKDESFVDIFYLLGIKFASLTHMKTNFLSDSSTDKPLWDGISPRGKKIIERMSKVGITPDISHLSDKAAEDIIGISNIPVVATHSCVRSLSDVKRNLNDRLIRLLARKGGVIGINFFRYFLNIKEKRASVKDVVRHIKYIKRLVGVEHVGIGTDFEGIGDKGAPEGIERASKMVNLVEELLKEGFTEKEIKMILGENFLRVLKIAEEKREIILQ